MSEARTDPQQLLAELADVLRSIPIPTRARLIAALERRAAQRYEGWAAELAADDRWKDAGDRLHDCAAREREIADRVEAMFAKQSDEDARLAELQPLFERGQRELFEGRPLREQLAIQAAGEGVGAATWRAIAEKIGDESAAKELEACARLEEASAAVLNELIASMPA